MVESSALLKRRSPKGYRGFESLPHRFPLEIPDGPSNQPAYAAGMNRLAFLLMAVAALFLASCADGLVDQPVQAPAPSSYSADPNAVVPEPQNTRAGTMPGVY